MTRHLPPSRRVAWRRSFRIIAGRYPPVALFERVADPDDWEALVEIESLTNERIRDEVGEISLIPPDERVSGPGASWVMGAFTHIGRPSRFSDGSYGVYYTARTRACAVAETCYHQARFLSATDEPACELDMRVLEARVDGALHDIRGGARAFRAIYDADDYAAAQRFGGRLRGSGSNGIAYDSVRLVGGQCVAAFRPRVIKSLPRVERRLLYHWDGQKIDRWFDYQADRWISNLSSDL